MSGPLNPETAARLLHAKAAELETYVLEHGVDDDVSYLHASVALIATLLADEIERNVNARHYHTATGKVLTDESIQALADEAERGYDVSHLKDRP
jgi:hypothetical protein